MDELDFLIEYAKSGRASCRNCKQKIDQSELRIARMVQSFRHDGKDAHWFHKNCFFQKHHPKSIDEIANFESIRIEDQNEVKAKIQEYSGILLPETSKGKKGKKRPAEDANAALKDFGIEYSKSSRATCTGCQNFILKDEVRIKKVVYDTEIGARFGGQSWWHHVECFSKICGSEYGYYLGAESLPGFKDLSPSDQKMAKSAIKAIKIDASMAKKLKGEPKDKEEIEKENALENLITKQTKQMFKVRDTIQKLTTKANLQHILFSNDSGMVVGHDALLDRCSDFLTFGAIKKCSKCKTGDLIFAKFGYKCNGNIDEWTVCDNFEEKPKRIKCKIPSDLKSKAKDNFFSKYVAKVEDRAVRPNTLQNIKKNKDEEERVAKVTREREPLYKMEIVSLNISTPKEDLKAKITKLGGKLVTKIHEGTAVVISTPDEVEKMGKRMETVKLNAIQVVPLGFLDAVEKCTYNEAIEKIKTMAICDWGNDPLTRIASEEKERTKESIFERKKEKTATIKLKNGTALDPDSGLEDVAHVYRDKITNKLYTTVLTKTDIQKNKNSYYKMQVLESDQGGRYWLFKSWGRISTTIGDKKIDMHSSVDDACAEFEDLFHEKSGNYWGEKNPKKYPGKYFPVEIDYEDDEKAKIMSEKMKSIPSKLHNSVQELVKMIFDIDTMKKALLEFELDLEKMPLGRLSKNHLEDAYKTLNSLSELVARGAAENEFIGLSNKFFTLVPHSFGIKKAPIIDSMDMIKTKREMVDSLLEIEIAYSLLNDDQNDNDEVNPVDTHYEKLKTNIKPIDKNSKEFQLIKKYIENTHAKTHDQYSLEIEDVFAIERQNEKRRYKPFKKLHNRQLLWHGSRVTNYVGILSHGLKIAPPEAPVTGYMFGKGIYFADMVSKSANYCMTSSTSNTGLMLLSEVALGDMKEMTRASYVQKLPPGIHSVKGLGKTSPDPQGAEKLDDGVIVPCGKALYNDNFKSDLLYNEYIVYDVAQVNVKYLLKLKFNYKKR